MIEPTYFVAHPDGTYSEAVQQPTRKPSAQVSPEGVLEGWKEATIAWKEYCSSG